MDSNPSRIVEMAMSIVKRKAKQVEEMRSINPPHQKWLRDGSTFKLRNNVYKVIGDTINSFNPEYIGKKDIPEGEEWIQIGVFHFSDTPDQELPCFHAVKDKAPTYLYPEMVLFNVWCMVPEYLWPIIKTQPQTVRRKT